MRIPSYDDLTPSIPDITPRETFAQVTRFLPQDRPAQPAAARVDPAAPSTNLYACLRCAGGPSMPAPGSHVDPKTLSPHVLVAREFSPRLERHGPAAVVLDIGGLGRLLGDAHAIGAELAQAAARAGADLQIAIARTQTAARLLAAARSGLTIADRDAGTALAPLPLDTLRVILRDDEVRDRRAAAQLAAVSDRLATFRRWGLTTLGQIAALPAADLSERMGQDGLVLQQLARGIDRAPLVPDPDVPRFLQSMELEWPIDTLEPLSFVLARLLDPLASALERADRGAAALRLSLRLVDRTMHARVLQLPAAMRDARVLRTLLLLDLESHPPAAAIDVVTLEIDPVPARIVQYSLLERAIPSPETVATLMARLTALVGDSRCGSPMLVDSWRPDAFDMQRFNPERGPVRAQRPAPDDPRPRACPAAAAPPLPLKAGEPRIANPDVLVVRRFRPPVAVRVSIDRGRPVHVAIDRRGMPGGAVEQAAGPWRTSGAWWQGSAAWDRDEWDVALSDGSVCCLFHDRLGEGWFLDGVLD